MTTMQLKSDLYARNPVDVAEMLMLDREWSFDRPDERELVAEVTGMWTNYRMWLHWSEEVSGLMISCGFEQKLPKQHHAKVYSLLSCVNEKLWVGAFLLNSEDSTVLFRHTLLLGEEQTVPSDMLRRTLDLALEECERFYPAFQSVVWGGKAPAEALEIALFETVAEA